MKFRVPYLSGRPVEIHLVKKDFAGDVYEVHDAQIVADPKDVPVNIYLAGEGEWSRCVGIGLMGHQYGANKSVTIHVGGKYAELSADDAREIARRLIDAAEQTAKKPEAK